MIMEMAFQVKGFAGLIAEFMESFWEKLQFCYRVCILPMLAAGEMNVV